MFPRPVLLLVGVVACLALGALVLRPLDMAVVSRTSGHQAKAPATTTSQIPGPGPSHGVPTALATQAASTILVRYKHGLGSAAAAKIESGLRLGLVKTVPGINVRVLKATGGGDALDALKALRQRHDVDFVESEGYFQASDIIPNDPYWSNQWSPVKTNAPAASSLTTGSPQVIIADLDSGVTPVNDLPAGRIVAGYNFVGQGDTLNTGAPTDTRDDNGHGTWVAGVAAAQTNDSIGVAAYCWQCSIMPVKVLDSSGNGSWSNVAAGITWAADHGARVINMSFGGPSGSSTVQSAIDYAHAKGCVLVAAAGNNSSSAPFYPAAYPGVIGVAATTSADALATYSDYGSWVMVAAPGDNWSVAIQNGYYVEFQGTSSATPVVAGLAGLALSLAPSSTNAQVEQAIEAAAVSVGSIVRYGRVDVNATLLALGAVPAGGPSPSPAPVPSPSPSPSPTPGVQTHTFSGTLNPGNPTRSYTFSVGSGTTSARLSFTKCASLTLTLTGSAGESLATSTGPSVLPLSAPLTAGSYTFVVGGGRCSFTLTVSSPAP